MPIFSTFRIRKQSLNALSAMLIPFRIDSSGGPKKTMGNADRLRGQKKRPGCDEARFPPVCPREGEFHSSNQRIGIGCRPGGLGGHSTTRISRMAISNDGTLQFAAETNTGIYLSTENSRGDQTSPRSSRGEFASGHPERSNGKDEKA
jgi:hypothetical protein